MRIKYLFVAGIFLAAMVAGFTLTSDRAPRAHAKQPAAAATKLDRTVLPIPEPNIPHTTVLDARNAKAPPRFEVKAPARRAQRAHRADRRHGLRHVERLRRADPHADASSDWRKRACATTSSTPRRSARQRAALLTGRNHHMCNMGSITETATGVSRPNRAAAQQRRAAGPNAAAERLQHRRLRQEPRDRGLGGQPFGPDRSLADAFRLRQVLRLHRRRDRTNGRPCSTTG